MFILQILQNKLPYNLSELLQFIRVARPLSRWLTRCGKAPKHIALEMERNGSLALGPNRNTIGLGVRQFFTFFSGGNFYLAF